MTAQQGMPSSAPIQAPRRCQAIRCPHLVGAHAAAGNHDATSMRRPTQKKES